MGRVKAEDVKGRAPLLRYLWCSKVVTGQKSTGSGGDMRPFNYLNGRSEQNQSFRINPVSINS
jgi:hypothetical protein